MERVSLLFEEPGKAVFRDSGQALKFGSVFQSYSLIRNIVMISGNGFYKIAKIIIQPFGIFTREDILILGITDTDLVIGKRIQYSCFANDASGRCRDDSTRSRECVIALITDYTLCEKCN